MASKIIPTTMPKKYEDCTTDLTSYFSQYKFDAYAPVNLFVYTHVLNFVHAYAYVVGWPSHSNNEFIKTNEPIMYENVAIISLKHRKTINNF